MSGSLSAIARTTPCFSGSILLALLITACGGDKTSKPQTQTLSVISVNESPGITRKLAVVGQTLYLASEDAGLVIWNVADPLRPARLGSGLTAGLAYHVTVAGSNAFVATQGKATQGRADSSLVAGSNAPVAAYGGLNVFDVSLPDHPVLRGSVEVGAACAERIAVRGQLGLVATCNDGLAVIDVTATDNPTITGTLPALRDMYDARFVEACSGRNVVAAASGSTLYLLEIEGNSGASLRDSLTLGDIIYGLYVKGTTVYVADRYAGIAVVSVGCDGTLALAGSLDIPGNARDIAVVGSQAFVASSEDSALYVVDVTDPAHLVLEQDFDLDGSKGVAANSEYVYVAGNNGFTILGHK